MKAWSAAFLLGSAMALATAGYVEPVLPAWEDGGPDGFENEGWIAGAALLTEETGQAGPEEERKSGEQLIEVAGPTAEEAAEDESPPTVIAEQFWPEYFEARPRTFLVDPQRLLSQVDYRDRLGFLNYHAEDSSIDLFVYVFTGDQEIPGEVREEELAERFFAEGRPAVVVYYFMGAPQRSMLYLSPSLTDAVAPAEQRRAMESSVMQAFRHVEATRQIEAFLVQMSIRIYWMERLVGGGNQEKEEVLPVPELVKQTTGVKEEAGPRLAMWQPLLAEAGVYLPAGGGLCGVLAAGWLAAWWMRRKAKYRFPDFEVEPRLGGVHAAGVGAVISFASAAVPPASQRDQVPDYLRRA